MLQTKLPHCGLSHVREIIGHGLCDWPQYEEKRQKLNDNHACVDSELLSMKEDVILGLYE